MTLASVLALLVAAYALAVNLAGFVAFAWDKHRARSGLTRVPERTLLKLAAVGGTIGVVIGQRTLRHKTWKEPFRTRLRWIIVAQVAVLVAVAILWAWSRT